MDNDQLPQNELDEPQLTHFADRSSDGSGPSYFDGNVDRSHLADLYPAAKTSDQLQQDERKRQALLRKRLPKYPQLSIALGGSVIFIALLLLVPSVGDLWQSGSISAIFFSFALSLVFFGSTVMWIRYANKTLYGFGVSARAFWGGYSWLVVLLMIAYGLSQTIDFAGAYLIALLGVTHFILLGVYSFALLNAPK